MFSYLITENCVAVIYVLLVTSIKNSCHKWLNIQVDEHNKTDFQCFKTNRVEELFNLVEEEFATDQGDALTLLTTMFANLTRENKFKGAGLQPNGLPKSHDDIESVKKQEEKDANEEAEKVWNCSFFR